MINKYEVKKVANGYMVSFITSPEDEWGLFDIEENVFHTLDDVMNFLKTELEEEE